MHFAKRLQANENGLKRNDKICKIKRSSTCRFNRRRKADVYKKMISFMKQKESQWWLFYFFKKINPYYYCIN